MCKQKKWEYNKKIYQLNKEKQGKCNNKIWYQNSEERQLKLRLENNDYQKEIMINAVNKIADEYPAINALSGDQKICKFYL